MGKAAHIPAPDLPRLLSLTDQIGHYIHSIGVTAVDILGEGVEYWAQDR